MTDAEMIDNLPRDESRTSEKKSKSLKRKRVSSMIENVSAETRESMIDGLSRELDSLFRYFKEDLLQRVHLEETGSSSVNSVFACLLEGSNLPFSKLVNEIYEKHKTRDGISLSSVRSTVLLVGQRSIYGIANPDADVLEDDTEKCLWCWEARDLKLFPKNHRGLLNIWRIGRKKISERVNAVSAMISVLQRPENYPNYKIDLIKASEKIVKVLAESDIRLLVKNMVQQNGADRVEKEARLKEKKLIKELERNKREVEEKKKKELLQNEKELKRLQDEAEKVERRREKEEAEMKRQLKKQQEEAEKDQRRREREEAELKKKLAVQKQASIMERFLKLKKNNSSTQDNQSYTKVVPSDPAKEGDVCMHSAVALSMDSVLSLKDSVDTNDLRRSHMDSWNKLGHRIRSGRSRHWGMRNRPKILLIKELKLQGSSSEAGGSRKLTAACKGTTCSDELSMENLVDGLEESIPHDGLCHANADNSQTDIQTCNRTKKLLQFDKSHRPAYYGTMSKKSDIIGPRHPLKKDPNLDYDIESDEEWEEEDPGESLSDCDEEETLEEGNVRTEDEDGSEDGFVVPDGYLSENEGVQGDSMESDPVDNDAGSSPTCKQDLESEEFRVLFRQQKYICKLTEHALKKNQPLFILNLMHEKAELLTAEGLNGTPKVEQIYLQALSVRTFPFGPPIEISTSCSALDEDQEVGQSQSKGNNTPVTPGMVIQDKDLHKIVWSIQSCPHGINKVTESLQQKFPTIPKSQLRSKVREISDFIDNRWQVKKEILDMLGLPISPEKCGERTKGIAAFFSKRCLPPSGGPIKTDETTPHTSHKPEKQYNDQAIEDNPSQTNRA